jgi:hypothetical protein
MARPLPPPLPPAERTVGQLVAEAIRLYGRRFWRSLALGLSPAVLAQLSWGRSYEVGTILVWAWTPLLTASYLGAVALTGRLERKGVVSGFVVGLLVFLPVPVLLRFYLLPAVAWLALFGLAVPAAARERLSVRDALTRGRRLATADFVHACGSLCTLVIVAGLSEGVLFTLLHAQASTTLRIASFLATLVVSPLVFLGAALLYFDQAARVVDSRSPTRRKSDADLHPAVDADRPGRPDAEVQP